MKKQISLPNLEPKEDSKIAVSPSKKRRPSSEQPWGNALRGRTSHFLDRWQQVVVMRLSTGHSRLNAHMFREMKLAPSPIRNCGLEDQTAELILQRVPLLETARTNVCTTAVCTATHQTLWQQGGHGEDGHIYLADWTLSVAAIQIQIQILYSPSFTRKVSRKW